MKKTTLLIKYNKVTNEAFEKLSPHLSCKVVDVSKFGKMMDVLPYAQVDQLLKRQMPFDNVVVGDVFWPTGQHICEWCKNHQKRSVFLQHGQWIYTKNKTNPRYTPSITCVYGELVKQMIDGWPYAKTSDVYATGNPRYDGLDRSEGGDYLYFCPPVILEQIPSGQDRMHVKTQSWVTSFRGLDKRMSVVVHPHYREGGVKTLKKLFPKAEFADPQADPMPLIQKAKGVLTHRNSTTVIDAIACGRPSILMNYGQFEKAFFRRGYFGKFAVEINSPSQVQMPNPTDPKGYIESAKPYVYLEDASIRVANLIETGIM